MNKLSEKFKNVDINAGFDAMFGAASSQAPIENVGNDDTGITEIAIDQLFPYGFYDEQKKAEHRFRPCTEEKLEEIAESMKRSGVLTPLIVRKRQSKQYEIIAGHNRLTAAKMAGLMTVPCFVKDIDDDQAALEMIETNLMQREHIYPTDRGYAYRTQLDILNRQGHRSDLTYSHSGNKSAAKSSSKELAEKTGESTTSIYRYVRLTYLIQELQNMVDEGELGIVAGESLSYIPDETQMMVWEVCREHEVKIKPGEAKNLRVILEDKKATKKQVEKMLVGEKEDKKKEQKPVRISFSRDIYDTYFKDKKVDEIEELIMELLDAHFKNVE